MTVRVGNSSSKRLISHPLVKQPTRQRSKDKVRVQSLVAFSTLILLVLLLQRFASSRSGGPVSTPRGLDQQQDRLRSTKQSKPFVATTATIAQTTSDNLHDVERQPQHEPWHIIIAHEPRYDLLGSFVLPTLYLYAVTSYHTNLQNTRSNHTTLTDTWELQILPFTGTHQHAKLEQLFSSKGHVSNDLGSGFRDASHRSDYDPMKLNVESYDTLGFFPSVSQDQSILTKHNWVRTNEIPLSRTELHQLCESHHNTTIDNEKECYLLLPGDPNNIRDYIDQVGGMDRFFTREFSYRIRDQFLAKNSFRLQHYDMMLPSTNAGKGAEFFNVAVHIRRGDILDPTRWVDQRAFANVARQICQMNTALNPNMRTNIHVFSSGPNRDGNWSMMEELAQPTSATSNTTATSIRTIPPACANVYFHLDELEFDSWTYMIAADALVISPSTFSYVPALIRYDNVYFPMNFWHPTLSSFTVYDNNGQICPDRKQSRFEGNVYSTQC
jgi:hypothetical protein